MEDEILSYYIEAGEIASSILRKSAAEVRTGGAYLEFVEGVERRVAEAGAGLAFPLNLSVNEAAAHDTAGVADERVFMPGDVVKVDLGVHIEGYIADCATTVDLGNNPLLVEASREALDHAIRLVRPGVTVGEMGAAIQREIELRGFRPIANLTGHGLDRFIVHRPPNIPNIGIQGGAVLEEGMVFAIEPFATTGTGLVGERRKIEIYSQTGMKSGRLPSARQVIDEIKPLCGLPFARRWITVNRPDIAIATLVKSGVLHPYPVLADVQGSLVSQHEHTVIVTSEGARVTTI